MIKSMRNQCIAVLCGVLFASTLAHAQAKSAAAGNAKVVEEIIARVNNDIITLSDYQKAQATVRQEVEQECQNCAPARIDEMYNERAKNLLRDQIDQSLLVQRGKDQGLSVETDVIKRLDQVRQQNNLPSLEELEKAVEAQGISWEDYKNNLRNSLLTQEVVRRDVGPRVSDTIDRDMAKKYYDEHKAEFVRPEQVYLAEIFFSTEGKSADEIEAIRKKANDTFAKVKAAGDFSELARRYSDGSTSKEGGELGAFERGQLAKPLEDQLFKMPKGDTTEIMQTKTGFQILKVIDHFDAGQQAFEKVQGEIMNRLYMEHLQPALRSFLAELREESYLVVKPGYTDSAAVTTNTGIKETLPTPDAADQKLNRKGKRAAKPGA